MAHGIVRWLAPQPSGIPSAWERAATEDHRSALANLYENTDICRETSRFTPMVDKVLNQIYLERSFIDETRTLTSHSNNILLMPMGQSSGRSLNAGAAFVYRDLHTMSNPQPVWKAPSLIAVSEAIPSSSGTHSEDASILLAVLSFFSTSDKIP